MSDDAQEWRWVGEDGVQKTVPEPELIAGLSSESLPNYTLVWKQGWLEWLPAMQVEELAWALPPGKSDDPIRPRETASANPAPAPPLYRYPVLKRRASGLRADRSPSNRPAAPRPAGGGIGRPSALRGPLIIEPKTMPLEETRSDPETDPRPQPAPAAPGQKSRPFKSFEDIDIDSIEASNPVNEEPDEEIIEPELDSEESFPDLPSEPRAGGGTYGEDDDVQTRVIRSRPPPAGPMYVGPHVPPASERPPPSYEEIEEEVPRFPAPRPPPADLSAYAGTFPSAERRRPLALYVLGGLVGVLALAVVFLVARGGESGDPEPAAAGSAASAEAEEAPPPPSAARADTVAKAPSAAPAKPPPPRRATPPPDKRCDQLTAATKVADWAEPGVMPSFTAIPGSARIAVGLGQSDVYAIGITIDPKTLDRDQVFREFRKAKLISVVPTAGGGKLQFQVVRSGHALSNARAVDAPKPFVLGSTKEAVARVVGKGEPLPIWQFAGAEEITVPRVATVSGVGHAVTFRRGGKTGKVAVGWLDPAGKKRTDLVDLRTTDDFAGTPALAANESGILIAYASRGASGASWSVTLATAKHGDVPRRTLRFELPPGGPGGDGISPSVAALSGNRWLLQWTEGASGRRVVRVQVLAPDLTPLTEAENLSPEGANAGQGAAWTSGSTAAVLFYVQNDKKSHELWGASVECSR